MRSLLRRWLGIEQLERENTNLSAIVLLLKMRLNRWEEGL